MYVLNQAFRPEVVKAISDHLNWNPREIWVARASASRSPEEIEMELWRDEDEEGTELWVTFGPGGHITVAS